jgi:polyisoprenoid-binding protein YceI
MKNMEKWIASIFVAATLAVASSAATTTWQIDPAHSDAHFVVRHLGINNVQGDFAKVSGTITLDESDVTKSSITASVDIGSIDTRVEARDKDLRSPKFFDVATFPTMTFQSTKIEKAGGDKLKMTGNLTMHGITKQVTFDVVGPTAAINHMGIRRGAEATLKISRKDFGVSADSDTIGDEIAITLNVEMLQPGTAPGR